ncbi:MAG: hypothetical protein JWO94_903 [Verrucomicrobiaceae bacterium]|nr:hypothetical protein [Verrucomicrobiaceae bacterium]
MAICLINVPLMQLFVKVWHWHFYLSGVLAMAIAAGLVFWVQAKLRRAA